MMIFVLLSDEYSWAEWELKFKGDITMKNYEHQYYVEKVLGLKEILGSEYTAYQHKQKEFISKLSGVLKAARCGWDEVKYKVMRHPVTGMETEYMVLCVDGSLVRWVPITGNSMGANLEVLGQNIW